MNAQLVSEAIVVRPPSAAQGERYLRIRARVKSSRAFSAAEWAARVDAAKRGDVGEYRRLLGAIAQLARRIAHNLVVRCNFPRAIVDDVVQETLVAVHQKLPHWDRSRPLETWVMTVARNKTVDAMREARLHRFRPLDDFENIAAPPFAGGAESRVDVPRLMARLSPRGREIVVAIALRQESIEDVATRLAISKGAVRVAFHRAIRQMGERQSASKRRQDGANGKALRSPSNNSKSNNIGA